MLYDHRIIFLLSRLYTNGRLKKIYLKNIMKPFKKNQTVFVFNTFYFELCSCVNHCSLTLQLLSLCFDKSFI